MSNRMKHLHWHSATLALLLAGPLGWRGWAEEPKPKEAPRKEAREKQTQVHASKGEPEKSAKGSSNPDRTPKTAGKKAAKAKAYPKKDAPMMPPSKAAPKDPVPSSSTDKMPGKPSKSPKNEGQE